ncbi:hypothetical protein [Halobaculum sp. EA56]|uniref:hypothetical protein n=1 Tax=Halobaculum sp. EA56 TaxID=3421648 RepID=UPI003EBA06C9
MPPHETHDGTRPNAVESLETVIVDVEEILQGLKFNQQPPEYKDQRHAVLRIHPPFFPESEATLDYIQSGDRYPPEIQNPIHVAPAEFLEDRSKLRPKPRRKRERRLAEEELGADSVDAETVDEWLETAMNLWEDRARSLLADEIEIRKRHPEGPHSVDVRYRRE